jgi:hypothetical protein
MNKKIWNALTGMIAVAGIASAADISVVNNITTSASWTSNNVYHLEDVIYIEPGASLMIQAGTLIRGNTDGSLNVAPGGKLYVNGAKNAPVIMTSEDDDLTTWRASCQEWGALTVMGKALISATLDLQGTGQPDGTDTMQMEGLSAAGSLSVFGGNNDNDDSGSISYLSLRYGGKVLAQANELNGLSLGGVGRETDIHHVEIMNNVDDGIEIWGGTVNLKYVSIWNIGDDSFDLDSGYRGKAQFGLIVQGACKDFAQGDGVGDNCFEMDGAENSSAQPVGAPLIYNFTTIGQPLQGDVGTEWRDNMRAQFHNSIFMDLGDVMIKDGGTGGGGGQYSGAGTSLAAMFTTPYSNYPSNTAGIAPAVLYPNFTQGFWAEFKDCVFRNLWGTDTTLTTFGQMDASKRNTIATQSPVALVQRAPSQSFGGKAMVLVTNLNPCAANDAVFSDYPAPNDGFFTPVKYKGAFSPNYNWLEGWTAADAFGMTDTSMNTNAPAVDIARGMVVSFQSETGVSYTIERADSVSGPWSVATRMTGDGTYLSLGDAELQSSEFYRVIRN